MRSHITQRVGDRCEDNVAITIIASCGHHVGITTLRYPEVELTGGQCLAFQRLRSTEGYATGRRIAIREHRCCEAVLPVICYLQRSVTFVLDFDFDSLHACIIRDSVLYRILLTHSLRKYL